MKQKNKVLWVEDAARYDLAHLAAPVIMDGGYDLVVAENASDGIAQLLQSIFDAIVVDIRIPPGNDKAWINLYEMSGYEKVSARLGRCFLYTILGHPNAEIKLDKRPEWIIAEKVGVLTVESHLELDEDLKELGITVYHQKHSETPETILLELIEKVLKRVNHGEEGSQ
jgi:hypothetical protein